MGNDQERLEIEDVPVGTWCWLIHHRVIVERSTEPLARRVDFVRTFKPRNEVPIRLKWMRPVKGKLPIEVVEAEKAFREAEKACTGTYRKIYEEAGKAYGEVGKAYGEAEKAYEETIERNRPEIEKLHREECPGCPWDWDQGTLFPEAK